MNTNHQADFDNAIKNIPFHNYLQPAIQGIITPIMDYFEAQAASIFIKVGANLPYDIACFGSGGFTRNLSGIANYKSGEGFTGTVFQTGQARLSNNLKREKIRSKYNILKANSNIAHNIMAVPLIYNGRIIGVAKVEDKEIEKSFTKSEIDDFQQKALQIAKSIYDRAVVFQNIPFLSPSGGYDIFPPASLVFVPYQGHFYVGGIRTIRITENNDEKVSIVKFFNNYLKKHSLEFTQASFQKILNSYTPNIFYDVFILDEGTIPDIKQEDIKLFNELVQVNDFVHFKLSYPNAKFENKGVIETIDYNNFRLTIKVTEGASIGSIQQVPFWNIRKPLGKN